MNPGMSVRALSVTALAAVVAAGLGSARALASDTTLNGSVSTSTAGTLVQQGFVNARSVTLTGVSTGDAVGNASTADGQLLAGSGIFTLTAGARSGGGAGTGGQANTQAHCDVTQVYVISSSTLPAGTLVPVTIAWALDAHADAAGNLTHYLSGATGEVDGQVQVIVNGTTVMNKTGVYRRGYDTTSGGYNFVSGTLNMLGDFGVVTANVPVGQTVRLYLDMTTSGVTSAVLLSTTGADAEAVMLWGVSVTGGDAVAVLQTNLSEVAPSAASATPAHAALALPPRPAGSLSCLGFSAQPGSLTRCSQGEASFSVTAAGSGPFTYQWRRNGAAINAAFNPSAATSTLNLSSVSGADAGSYDCVVSNFCGGVASAAALLMVDPADVGQQGGIAGRDGFYDNNDFIVFIDLFFNRQPAADLGVQGGIPGSDGQFDNNDFIVFIDRFFAGC